MGLKDQLYSLIDNVGLADVFNRKEADPAALRRPLLKGIERTKDQFESGRTKAPNRWWTVRNDTVALTVKVGGDTLDINGVATNHMPVERFAEFLDKFKAAVEAGEFDDELKNKGNGDAKVHIGKTPGARKPLSPLGSAGIKIGTWSKTRSEAQVRKMLADEGFEKSVIDEAFAKRKAAAKK